MFHCYRHLLRHFNNEVRKVITNFESLLALNLNQSHLRTIKIFSRNILRPKVKLKQFINLLYKKRLYLESRRSLVTHDGLGLFTCINMSAVTHITQVR